MIVSWGAHHSRVPPPGGYASGVFLSTHRHNGTGILCGPGLPAEMGAGSFEILAYTLVGCTDFH